MLERPRIEKRRKHSVGLQNNDAISIYIVTSIMIIVIVISFFLSQTVCRINQPQPLNLVSKVPRIKHNSSTSID